MSFSSATPRRRRSTRRGRPWTKRLQDFVFPGLPLCQGPGGPPDAKGDGEDSGGDDGATPLSTDEVKNKPNGDLDCNGDGDGYGFVVTSMRQ